MTFPVTIAADGSYDIDGSVQILTDVQVTNWGPGSVVHGDVPGAAVVRNAQASEDAGGDFLTMNTEADARAISEGMLVTDGEGIVDADTVVTRIDGKLVYLNKVTVGAGGSSSYATTFTPPALSIAAGAENGHPLAAGETVRFSAAAGTWRNQVPRRFQADASGARLTVTKTQR